MWICGGRSCGKRWEDNALPACPGCGWKRELRQRKPTATQPRVLHLRVGDVVHVVTVLQDRSVGCNCGGQCEPARVLRDRLTKGLDHKGELVTVEWQVYDVLERHPEARDSDLDLFIHLLNDHYPDAPRDRTAFFEWLKETGHGNLLETARRRRAEHQNDRNVFPPLAAVADERRLKEAVYADTFAPVKGRYAL